MKIQECEFIRFLRFLDELGVLGHVILVGSWVEFTYERAGVLEGFNSNIKTMDIDFLVRNLRRPDPAVQLAAEARRQGYLVESDVITGVTKIYSAEGLEMEFLIGKRGAGMETALRTNIGVTAQSLRHTDILARSAIAVEYSGMRVFLPSPEAYVVHKMVINHDRGKKREKDSQAIANLWPYLSKAKTEAVVSALTKREKSYYEEYVRVSGLEMDDGS